MAWSSAALASYETARLALDKPLIAAQAIPVSPSYAKWVEEAQVAAGNITTWTDRSATANPARRAYDGYPGYITKQSGTNDDIWYYCLDLGALTAFDCAFLVGHNAGTLGLVNDLVLQVADDNAFSTNLTTVGNFGQPSDDTRVADLTLVDGGTTSRITAQYVWLKWDKTGTNITPEIGELILGRRRQLEYKPIRPYDEYALSESSELVDTKGGVIHKSLYARRGRELAGDLWVTDSTYLADLVAFFRACRGPFVWVENPSSAAASWNLMMREGGLSIPQTDANLRKWAISAMEQGDESYYLDVEENG